MTHDENRTRTGSLGLFAPRTGSLALAAAIVLFAAGCLAVHSDAADGGEPPSFLVAAMRVEPQRWNKDHNMELLRRYAARDSGRGDELVYARIELDENVGSGDILHRRSPEVYRELIDLPARGR